MVLERTRIRGDQARPHLSCVIQLHLFTYEEQGEAYPRKLVCCRVSIINLLNVLSGSRPKNTIPAIFNAIYSRTNPNALDPHKVSTLTSDLADTDLVSFLVEYTQSLEDDAMDEIWADCMAFLRDVLGNPMPHRQILPTLLEFIAMLAEKVDNTNFGEQKKMRRELGVGRFSLKQVDVTNKHTGPFRTTAHSIIHYSLYGISSRPDIFPIQRDRKARGLPELA